MFRDFCKIDSESSLESLIVIRVKSFGKKRDSCQVESPFCGQRDSSRVTDLSPRYQCIFSFLVCLFVSRHEVHIITQIDENRENNVLQGNGTG